MVVITGVVLGSMSRSTSGSRSGNEATLWSSISTSDLDVILIYTF